MEKGRNMCAAAYLSLIIVYLCIQSSAVVTQNHWLDTGFKANSDPSAGNFQPLLTDPTAIFSLGFLKTSSFNFDLAVVHAPSTQPLWRASVVPPVQGSGSVSLSFNGSLVFSGDNTGVLWSTPKISGDRVVLLNSSNLQLVKLAKETSSVLWQSFDFPSDTIVENQNFTSFTDLFSANGQYFMKLGSTYLALFMEFGHGVTEPMYWKRAALQSKNPIVANQGPLYARVDPAGYIGLYQKENASVDVVPFDSFGRGIPGFRRLVLEDDGNLRGYYWNGTIWVTDYVAIMELCELPNPCGPYGLCRADEPRCGCIYSSGGLCLPPNSGYRCGGEFSVVRTNGIDLGNKDVLSFVKTKSMEECEGLCERNCSCRAAVYNNGSGHCYAVNYPVQTVVAVGDDSKMVYFKLTNMGDSGRGNKGKKTAEVLVTAGVMAAVASGGIVVYCLWSTRRRRRLREAANGSMMEGLSPGPYKDLNSSSFRSIELVDSFRK